MFQGHLLTFAIWIPIVFGVAVLAMGDERDPLPARWTALAGSVLGFLVCVPLWTGFDRASATMQFVIANPNPVALTGATFTDPFPAGLVTTGGPVLFILACLWLVDRLRRRMAQWFTIDEVTKAAIGFGLPILAAAVWTRDVSSAHRLAAMLKAGSVYVNAWGLSEASAPFGGFKASGIGREHGHEGLEAYLETKTVWTAL